MSDISQLEKKIGVEFKNKDLLRQAFVHRSYLNENPSANLSHNERLEFLGDAVLELVITELLYAEFPEKPEGELTTLRAALVNSKMLADVATTIGMNEFLLLSRGESRDVGRARQYILANTLESLTGALYLDRGYDAAHAFLVSNVWSRLSDVVENQLYKDPKSLFQEEAQERVGITPTYEVVREWGPDHDKHFVVGVYLKKELVAEGEGPSKQAAQEAAAKLALHLKSWN